MVVFNRLQNKIVLYINDLKLCKILSKTNVHLKRSCYYNLNLILQNLTYKNDKSNNNNRYNNKNKHNNNTSNNMSKTNNVATQDDSSNISKPSHLVGEPTSPRENPNHGVILHNFSRSNQQQNCPNEPRSSRNFGQESTFTNHLQPTQSNQSSNNYRGYGNLYTARIAESNRILFSDTNCINIQYNLSNKINFGQAYYNYVSSFNRTSDENPTAGTLEPTKPNFGDTTLSAEEYDKKVVKDLRKWEPITQETFSTNGLDFTLLSYNVLAQDLLQEHPYIYKEHNPRACLWEERWKNLYKEILNYNADIICMQEVQQSHIQSYYSQFEKLGYGSLFKKRTGYRTDGCAIYFRKSMFKLVENTTIEYNQGGNILNRDNVAIIAKFATVANQSIEFVVATTHLLYNPKRMDVRLAQTQLLLAEVERIAYNGLIDKKYLPIIITGDFNAEPDSAVYELITKGYLQYEMLKNRTLEASDSSLGLTGKILISPLLKITDNCQHYEIKMLRMNGIRLSRSEELKLINLRHSKRLSTEEIIGDMNMTEFATGVLTHELNLRSVFSHNVADGNNTEATTFQNRWITVDYIFYSEDKSKKPVNGTLKLISKYSVPTANQMKNVRNIPNFVLGSDHLALLSKFRLEYN